MQGYNEGNKFKPIYVIAGVITFIVAISFLIVYEVETTNNDYQTKVVKVAMYEGEVIQKIVDTDDVMFIQYNNGNKENLRYHDFDNSKQVLELVEPYSKEVYTYIPEYPEVIDPVSLSMYPDIPGAYTSNIKDTSTYIDAMTNEGWETKAYYCDYSYCDYYLMNDNDLVRIIFSDKHMYLMLESSVVKNDPIDYIKE